MSDEQKTINPDGEAVVTMTIEVPVSMAEEITKIAADNDITVAAVLAAAWYTLGEDEVNPAAQAHMWQEFLQWVDYFAEKGEATDDENT
jgi:hypothetical protein